MKCNVNKWENEKYQLKTIKNRYKICTTCDSMKESVTQILKQYKKSLGKGDRTVGVVHIVYIYIPYLLPWMLSAALNDFCEVGGQICHPNIPQTWHWSALLMLISHTLTLYLLKHCFTHGLFAEMARCSLVFSKGAYVGQTRKVYFKAPLLKRDLEIGILTISFDKKQQNTHYLSSLLHFVSDYIMYDVIPILSRLWNWPIGNSGLY